MRMLIMGPPGAGKGTQADRIAEHYHIPAISTGAMFRAHTEAMDDLGQQIKRIMAEGGYVNDAIVNAVVDTRLHAPDARAGFLLDGYPRTLAQVEALDGILAREHGSLDVVLSLVADPDELVGRLLHRARVEGREDDNEDTIRTRMSVYADETEPLLTVYRSRDLLVDVDALGDVDEVFERIMRALEAHVHSVTASAAQA